MTCSNDSKPDGWIEPPDGWEWNSSNNEYVKNSTGVRIRYMTLFLIWQVYMPSVEKETPVFATFNPEYVFRRY